MQIKDIKSSELLPRFADKIAWIQNAFEEVCKAINLRTPAIDAPLAMESIEALTDSEIQYFFDSIGIIKYYPDISRSIQNAILYNLYKLQRYAGTPRVVELLCQYIFQDIDLRVSITDNLAFDDSGYIINPELLDLFDVNVAPSSNVLTPEIIDRIFKNIFSLSRNSQTIRDFNINYDPTNIDANAYIIAVDSVYNSINDAICEPVTPPVPEKMTLGGIITDISSTSFEVDAVEPMAQGSIEFTVDLLDYTMPSIGGIMAIGSIAFSGEMLSYTLPSIGGIIEEV